MVPRDIGPEAAGKGGRVDAAVRAATGPRYRARAACIEDVKGETASL